MSSMGNLILHPNETTQWHALVHDACNACNINISEDLESYLVFLLMRSTNKPEITQKIVALDFLESSHKIGKQKETSLQEVGDTCLLFSGLFPALARKRRVKINYYVSIGQTAYAHLSNNFDNSFAALFAHLSNSFIQLMDILQSMRQINTAELPLDAILANDIFEATGSSNALNIIKQYTLNKNKITLYKNFSKGIFDANIYH